MCQYFLNISSTFEQYRDNTDNRDNFGHYNRDKKFSYRYIPNCLPLAAYLIRRPNCFVNDRNQVLCIYVMKAYLASKL